MSADPLRWTDAVQNALVRHLGDARFVAELHRSLLPSTHVQAYTPDQAPEAEPPDQGPDQGIVFQVTDEQFGYTARFALSLRRIPAEPPRGD
ncbi:hypothetical protein [Actinomadura violacea]|uniref:Uncharacterized protein n=1 Tax=Actinomadura violacea TaxID=2819934 RepID=A0ABS3S7J2_9ACTN|nr:hypothetical protein [Actinomadura violacea]MBO2464971.1 hypothetical protein [Actinomadura violacea]